MLLCHARQERRLPLDARGHGNPIEMREILPVEIRKFLLNVHIAIEIDIAVRRMVIARVEVEEHLARERGNCVRIAARLASVRRIRVERRHDAAAEQIIRRRERALHLVVDNAAVTERRTRIVQFVMPALLHEHLRILTHRGVKYRVEIDVHQILEIARIAARHRVHRLVRERHRVQERIERALHQLHKRLFERILARPAEHRVLNDMRDARIVRRRRAEADRKDLVVVRRL